MTEQKSVRQRARERGALDGADAQALEHALTVTERERDEAQANYRLMVERAADEKLDGYRELASRLAAMEAERDEARRERDKARDELEAVADEWRRQHENLLACAAADQRVLLRVSRAAKAVRDWDAIGALLSGDEPHAEDAQNDLRELDDALRRAVLSTPLGAFCCPEEP